MTSSYRDGSRRRFPIRSRREPCSQKGWAGVENGKLLRLAVDRGFDALVTVDQGFEYQQNVAELPIPVVIMIAGRTRLQELQPLVPAVVTVLSIDLECRIHRVVA